MSGTSAMRRRLMQQQGGRCYLCQQRMKPLVYPGGNAHTMAPDPLGATIDHVYPRRHGGADDASNMAVACWTCNQSKDDLLPIDLTTPDGRDRALGLHTFLAHMATCTPLRRMNA